MRIRENRKTIIEKVWDQHIVFEPYEGLDLLYIDLHLIHEVTSPQAFNGLRERGLKVHRPDLTLATVDHSIPTTHRNLVLSDPEAKQQVDKIGKNCTEFGIPFYGIENERQGIVHVIGPELGLTQPGMTIVCGDSHTATHGAFGALAFGIGTTEVEQVLATQCLLAKKPKTFRIQIDGKLKMGVTSKDVILYLISQMGTAKGAGYVFEYCGSLIRSLSMEERMTICNMSIEAGAKAGMVSPDDVTFEYLIHRPFAPKGKKWEEWLSYWKSFTTDELASFDEEVHVDVSKLEPMITFGTNPSMGIGICKPIPDPSCFESSGDQQSLKQALEYMALETGKPLLGHPIDVVFIGSCTNSRLEDLKSAAKVLNGRKVNPRLRVFVVPGSMQVKKEAEREGLDRIFKEAGCDWREPGCSMCIAMNGDELNPGEYCVSTSNRNFEGRQGKGGRTFLASPFTAAACAVTGKITDVRTML